MSISIGKFDSFDGMILKSCWSRDDAKFLFTYPVSTIILYDTIAQNFSSQSKCGYGTFLRLTLVTLYTVRQYLFN